jgi:hypothetical protein
MVPSCPCRERAALLRRAAEEVRQRIVLSDFQQKERWEALRAHFEIHERTAQRPFRLARDGPKKH